MTHPLDNPVWNALSTGNKNLALGTETVKFYPTDVAPFVGFDQNSVENFELLYHLVPSDGAFFAFVSKEERDIPKPWNVIKSIPLVQMVYEKSPQRSFLDLDVKNLTDQHIPQMLDLTALTKPGPFRERTIDFGHYQGIFDGEQLVAMTGQRMNAAPYAEVSAVCTHPDYLGRGYAAQLMLRQISRMLLKGEIPFLHATQTNERAIKLYESLGFVIRSKPYIYLITKEMGSI